MLREIASTEIYTILLIVCLLLVAIARSMFIKRFQYFINILFNFKYIKIYARDHKFFDVFEGLLFTNFIIGLSILGIISYNMNAKLEIMQHISLLKLAVVISIIIIVKTLIERLVSSVLQIDFITSTYIFIKISYKNFLGLVLIPINILLIFTINVSQWVVIGFITLLLLINYIGIFLFIKDNLISRKNNLFYFILYLCALEIAPYFVLYKLITKLSG